MLKIVLLLGVVCACLARPSFIEEPVLPYGYELQPTVVGHTLHSIPTAVSHQSQTIVHEKRPYLRPIVAHAPVLKSYAVPQLLSPYYNGWDISGYGEYRPVYGGDWRQW